MIGIDIVEISRINKIIDKYQEKGLNKFLSHKELERCKKANKLRVESIAGIWALKEAFSKAIQNGFDKNLSLKDIEITKDSNNAPIIKIKKRIKTHFNIKKISASLSHDCGLAVGVVLVKFNKKEKLDKR